MYIIGIDVGVNGGIAILNVVTKTLYATRMPVFKPNKKLKRKKTEYDIPTLLKFFDIPIADVICVVLERVATMTGQGIASNGKLMYGLGLLEGLIARFSYQLVTPRVWKRKLSLSADKDLSRTRASEIFPKCADAKFWHTKNRDGPAEASLLCAWYALDKNIDLTEVTPVGV